MALLAVAQGELSRVLWPVFLQCYLGLVRRNATAEAHALMTRHGGRFKAAGPAGRHTEVTPACQQPDPCQSPLHSDGDLLVLQLQAAPSHGSLLEICTAG